MHGKHCLKHWSSTHTALSLSTAGATLHGIAKGIQVGIGFQSLCKDLNMKKEIRIHPDATAAIGIARRRDLVNPDIWMSKISGCGRKFGPIR